MVEAAKRLSLPKGTLKNWVYAEKRGELTAVGKRQKALTEVELELSRETLHGRPQFARDSIVDDELV